MAKPEQNDSAKIFMGGSPKRYGCRKNTALPMIVARSQSAKWAAI